MSKKPTPEECATIVWDHIRIYDRPRKPKIIAQHKLIDALLNTKYEEKDYEHTLFKEEDRLADARAGIDNLVERGWLEEDVAENDDETEIKTLKLTDLGKDNL